MASTNLIPAGDVSARWIAVPGPTHYGAVDETVASYDEDDYIVTDTDGDPEELSFEASPGDVASVSSITMNIRCGIVDFAESATLKAELFHSGGTAVTGNPKTIVAGTDVTEDGTPATITRTWGSLSLTKAQLDSITLLLTPLR